MTREDALFYLCEYHSQCLNEHLYDAMTIAIQELSNKLQSNGWISVKDRMPEQAGKRCLVCAKYGNNKNAVFIACIGYGSGEWETLDCLYMKKVRSPHDKKVHSSYVVTHWMPIPEPPKEVSE